MMHLTTFFQDWSTGFLPKQDSEEIEGPLFDASDSSLFILATYSPLKQIKLDSSYSIR